jgi:hypothetical protein
MTGNENVIETSFTRLRQLSLIRANGTDAETFLQGQLSNDVRKLTVSSGQLASYNSPKGRMLAVLHLLKLGEDIGLEVHRSVLEATLKRLRMFVLRSKVVLSDVSSSWPVLGLAGPSSVEVLTSLGLPAPTQILATALSGDLVVMRRFGALPRYSVHGPANTIDDLERRLTSVLPRGDEIGWKKIDLDAGLPTIYPETSDHFVPQMCNLDLLGGISFDKGCYTGQEIVARLHYLGTLKRRMYQAQVMATALPGQPVFDANGDTQAVGEVVDAVHCDGDSQILVVLQMAHAAGDLRLGALNGATIRSLRGPAIDA